MTDALETRPERDSLGDLLVPAEAYYRASTQRAVLNFPNSSLRSIQYELAQPRPPKG